MTISQLLRNWTTSCHTIASACASYKQGSSAVSTTSAAVDIPHTREVSSTLPKEHRLRCHRASAITGGGCDTDNSEELNRVGHPWPKENGNDVEAAAWHTSDSALFERAKNFWKAQCSLRVLLSTSLPVPLSSSSAVATHSSGLFRMCLHLMMTV